MTNSFVKLENTRVTRQGKWVPQMTASVIERHSEARPFWLSGPCPDWCVKDHLPGDFDQERHHADRGATVHLTLHEGWGSLREAQPLHLGLFHDPRAVEAYVELFWPFKDAAIRLTLAEAVELADYIHAAIAEARAANHTAQENAR